MFAKWHFAELTGDEPFALDNIPRLARRSELEGSGARAPAIASSIAVIGHFPKVCLRPEPRSKRLPGAYKMSLFLKDTGLVDLSNSFLGCVKQLGDLYRFSAHGEPVSQVWSLAACDLPPYDVPATLLCPGVMLM